MLRQQIKVNSVNVDEIDVNELYVISYANCSVESGNFTIKFRTILELPDASYADEEFRAQYENTLRKLIVGETLYFKDAITKYEDLLLVTNIEDNLYEKFIENKLCDEYSNEYLFDEGRENAMYNNIYAEFHN